MLTSFFSSSHSRARIFKAAQRDAYVRKINCFTSSYNCNKVQTLLNLLTSYCVLSHTYRATVYIAPAIASDSQRLVSDSELAIGSESSVLVSVSEG
jgi:hypothetical protein